MSKLKSLPKMEDMEIEAEPEVRSFIRERGGLLFVRARRASVWPGGGITMLQATTTPPDDALDWRRIESYGFLVFVPKAMKLPKTLTLQVHGRLRRRVDALWDGCAYVI
jgi:hypothetical protein